MPTLGKVNVSAIAAKFNTSELYARLPEPRSMEVKLPRFRIEYGQELEQALTSMGTHGPTQPATIQNRRKSSSQSLL